MAYFFNVFFSSMKPSKDKAHEGLHWWYKHDVTAAEATQKVNEFYGQVIISARQAQKWFKVFREGRECSKRKHSY